jgi:hypothetical protein
MSTLQKHVRPGHVVCSPSPFPKTYHRKPWLVLRLTDQKPTIVYVLGGVLQKCVNSKKSSNRRMSAFSNSCSGSSHAAGVLHVSNCTELRAMFVLTSGVKIRSRGRSRWVLCRKTRISVDHVCGTCSFLRRKGRFQSTDGCSQVVEAYKWSLCLLLPLFSSSTRKSFLKKIIRTPDYVLRSLPSKI